MVIRFARGFAKGLRYSTPVIVGGVPLSVRAIVLHLFTCKQDCIYSTIHSVLDAKPWTAAFDSNGFSHQQGHVSGRVLCGLQLQALAPVESTRPTLEEVRVCFPRRVHIPFEQLWRPLRAAPLPPEHGTFVALAPFGVPIVEDPHEFIAFRTRAGVRRSVRVGCE